MKLSNVDKLAASVAMLRGNSFTRANATMFPFGSASEYCVVQMVGPADKCKRTTTTSWIEALQIFEEYAGDAG